MEDLEGLLVLVSGIPILSKSKHADVEWHRSGG